MLELACGRVCVLLPPARWPSNAAASSLGFSRAPVSAFHCPSPLCSSSTGLFLPQQTGSSLLVLPKAQLNLEAGKRGERLSW